MLQQLKISLRFKAKIDVISQIDCYPSDLPAQFKDLVFNNNLQWPSKEFSHATSERKLVVKHVFKFVTTTTSMNRLNCTSRIVGLTQRCWVQSIWGDRFFLELSTGYFVDNFSTPVSCIHFLSRSEYAWILSLEINNIGVALNCNCRGIEPVH